MLLLLARCRYLDRRLHVLRVSGYLRRSFAPPVPDPGLNYVDTCPQAGRRLGRLEGQHGPPGRHRERRHRPRRRRPHRSPPPGRGLHPRGDRLRRRPGPHLSRPAHRPPPGPTGAPGPPRRRRPPPLPLRDRRDPLRHLDRRPGLQGPARPPGRDHGPHVPQDDGQRAQLGRQGLHGRLRGRHQPDLGQRRRGAPQHPRRPPPRPHARTGRQALPAQRGDRHPGRAPAWLAPARTSRPGRRPSRRCLARRLRTRLLPWRP